MAAHRYINPQFNVISPPMVIIVSMPTNREQKRKLEREVGKLVEHLFGVENNFMSDLFNQDLDNVDYEKLYAFHLSNYITLAKWFKKYGKLKFTTPNLDYFHNEFKPIEQ